MGASWAGLSATINVNELNEYVRHAALEMLGMAQLANAPTGGALGRKKGDIVQYTYYPNVNTSGGELSEHERVPRTSLTPIKGTYQIKEYGNALEWTETLEELSRLDVESDFMKALVDDLRRLENHLAFTEFDASSWIYTPSSTTDGYVTDGTATVTASGTMTFAKLRELVKHAEKGLIPYFDGENYVYATGVDSMDSLRYDTTVVGAIQQQSGRSALNGECGVLANCRLVKDTHKCGHIGGVAAATVLISKGYLVGGDAVLHEVAAAPEIRAEDEDFGRQVAVAYLFRGCYKKIYSQSLHSKEHIIKVASA